MDRQISAFELGVNAIDREHHQLMTLIAKFLDYVHAQASAEMALAVLRDALALANDHIEHEEVLMAETDYPAIDEHKLQHRTARLHYTTLMSDTTAILALDQSVVDHVDTIRQMIAHHIAGPDRSFAEYLNARGIH
jgi:hemerythrin